MTADRNPFMTLFNSAEYQAREADYQRARAKRRTLFLAENDGDQCVAFRDTEQEDALRDACKPLLGSGETWLGIYRLAGWDWCDGFDDMPDALIAAVSDAPDRRGGLDRVSGDREPDSRSAGVQRGLRTARLR